MSNFSFLTSKNDNESTPQEIKDHIINVGGIPPLNNEQTKSALNDLVVKQRDYPSFDRFYNDPQLNGQKYALFSFIPSKGATPDSDGFYGMAKIRGCFSTDIEAEQREEYIIRNVDSYNKIYRIYTGRPFPITTESKYSEEVNEIDIKKKVTEVVSQNIKDQKMKEKKEIEEIKDRERKLKEDTNKEIDEIDPLEYYTTLVVKRAQLLWNYQEHKKKMEEIRGIIDKTSKEIKEKDDQFPDFRSKVYDKYMEARRDSGLPDDDNSFIKYICEDISID